MIKFLAVLLVFLSFLVCEVAFADNSKPKQLKAEELSSTRITPYLKDNIIPGKNQIFCLTFQIAWDIVSDEIIKEPLQLDGHPPLELMLNERMTGAKDISENSYLAMAGLNRDGIEGKIRQALRSKFNEEPSIDISLAHPSEILAYAFLFKDLRFDQEFESLEAPVLFKGEVPVNAFGIKKYSFGEAHKLLGQQVEIIDYSNDNDFIISLKSSSPQDELILAKVKPGGTLLETVNSVFKRFGPGNKTSMKENDSLQIPKIDFDVLREYSEIRDNAVLNKGFTNCFLAKAIQKIRFRLNQKGALLKSDAGIKFEFYGGPMQRSKKLVFDQPFLLCLKEKSAKYPYLVMWIENAELLLQTSQ